MIKLKNIIVGGLGHGGLVAAMKMAQSGLNVKIITKESRENYGLEQKDSFDAKAMEYAGLEIPEKFRAPGNELTFVPLEDTTESLTLPANENYENLTVDRRDFLSYLISKAEDAGVTIEFGNEIKGPIILGSRVAGLKTENGDFYCDLVIDACGVNSPLRKNLPVFLNIENNIALYDVLHIYRAEFEKNEGVPDPETKYNLFLKDDGTVGFNWVITEDDLVDVLIARFHECNYSVVADALLKLSKYNPHMSSKQIRGGKFVDIPVRQPLAVFVADGYAAVGDSAFMTYAVKGSGIAYSLKAGTMLADAVIDDKYGLYNTETLWSYEARFFEEIGYDACRVALAKNLLPLFTAREVDNMFKYGLVTTEELRELFENGISELIRNKPIAMLKEKFRILDECSDFKKHLQLLIGWVAKFAVVEQTFPEKYDSEKIRDWAERYNKFFESVKRP